MGMTLQSLKRIDRLIVRLKAIEYKENFFCDLSFYPDLGLQATYFQILSFRPHAFNPFPLGHISSEFSTKHFCPNLESQIRFNHLNLVLYAKSVIDQIPKACMAARSQLLSCYCIELRSGRSNTREPYSLGPTSCILITRMAVSKA